MSMTVGGKIAAASGVLVAFTVVLATASLLSVGSLSERILRLQVDAIPGQYSSGRIDALAMNVRVKINAELIDLVTSAGSGAAQAQAAFAEAQAKLLEEMKSYEKTITTAEDRQVFGMIAPALDRCLRTWERVRAANQAAKADEAVALYRSETLPALAALQQAVEQLTESNHSQAKQQADGAAASAATAKWWSWVLGLLSVVVGVILALAVVRGINRALRQAVRELGEGADQVASSASEVSGSSQSLAQGSSEQAASLEETSASSEQINAMARKNSENSREAAGLVTASQQRFVLASQSLEQTVTAMGEIHTQSGKISKIIKVIDEIAFQTNILALNAAVEAARAGEAGMGFAVVADEVRNLAQRSAQAAKDTAELIEESIIKSNDGKVKVDQVAAAIRLITEEFGQVKTLVDEVNQGSQEQTRGIEEVAKAVLQMQTVTQSTAAGAEESAAAAQELNAQSKALKDVLGRLSAMVGGGGTSKVRADQPHRPSGRAAAPALAVHHTSKNEEFPMD